MKIGFIGIGLMGRWIARNLLAGGHQLTVSDLRKDSAGELLSEGASWAETPGEVAKASELIFTSLPLPRDVESVCTGEACILPAAASAAGSDVRRDPRVRPGVRGAR